MEVSSENLITKNSLNIMITEFYTRKLGFSSENQPVGQSLYLLKNQCLKNVKPSLKHHKNTAYFQQLESLFAQYTLNGLNLKFDTLAKDKTSPSLNEFFCSPTSRLPLLNNLPVQLQTFLYASSTSTSNAEFSEVMGLSQTVKDKLVSNVNLPPFSGVHHAIVHFEEAQRLLSRHQFDAACCASLLEVAINTDENCSFSTVILQEGINLACISSLIAKDKGLDPMRLFLTALTRSISLLLVHKQLQKQDGIPSKKQLFGDIKKLLPRLDYWIAKDLGLPDDILHTLKSRFIDIGLTPEAVNVLHISERCQLSILLFKQALISPKEIQKILQHPDIYHLNLMQKLQLLRH